MKKNGYFCGMKDIGIRIIIRAIELAIEKGIINEILPIVNTFANEPDELDLRTICVLEAKLGEKLLIIPTKQEWRKIKLQQLNDICNEL